MSPKLLTPAEVVEVRRRLADGDAARVIAAAMGCSHDTVNRVRKRSGGVPPRPDAVRPGCLSLAEREEISRGLATGRNFTKIAGELGRAVSTVSRDVFANGGPKHYRAWDAQQRAHHRARRPKAGKLACPRLAVVVTAMLEELWSPQQIAAQLKQVFPHEPEMWVSHETIYQSLYVQGRGSLRKELHQCLRSGQALRRTRRSRGETRGRIPDMVMISERPAEVEDRAVPGHWEGDLILGKNNKSAIGTLVERSSRYVMLLHLADGRSATQVRDAMTAAIQTLPVSLRRTLTWDQGKEMAEHVQFSIDTGIDVYFCDPHSPWQRGSNENTNGLLRQYFPKGTDLSVHDKAALQAAADSLNGRPRQTLNWMKPSEKLAELVALTA